MPQSVTGGPFGIGFIPRPFGSLAETPLAFNLANLALVAAVTAGRLHRARAAGAQPLGPRAARHPRGRDGGARRSARTPTASACRPSSLGSAIMGLAGAMQAHFIGFIAPENYLSAITFQVWAMLIIGGSGNNRGALLGAVLVWGLWSVTGAALSAVVPPEYQARAAALQIVFIGVVLAAVLLLRPRGLLGERKVVSRYLQD